MFFAHDEVSHETIEEALRHANAKSQWWVIIVTAVAVLGLMLLVRFLQKPKK